MNVAAEFLELRNRMLELRTDYERATREWRWPAAGEFNWALDFFDRVPPRGQPALKVVGENGTSQRLTFERLSLRSNQVANWLSSLGLTRGDALLMVLGNDVPLWETMLAAMKLGVVVIPCSTLLTAADLQDRITRGHVRGAVIDSVLASRLPDLDVEVPVAAGSPVDGWHQYAASMEAPVDFDASAPTMTDDPLLLYFTSGTTAKPKLVEHTHASYPIGHLTTMYAVGLRPGDVHLNLSSPGWAKHAWSSFFAPWNAAAEVVVLNHERFDPTRLLEALVEHQVTTFCAPPTVWRMLVQQDLRSFPVVLREVLSAGEPLNPEIINHVRECWGLVIRDFYGQTETTALIGNAPGQPVRPGSMGRPLPGYRIALLGGEGEPAGEGEICVQVDGAVRPLGVMRGYRDDPTRTVDVMAGGYYHTGDVAMQDADGYLTYVGRTDDVFKASDYRISPFELESVLVEHPAVAEAAVVPSPDPRRTSVPKAYVSLTAGWEADNTTADAILAHCRERLAPYQRVRRIEFATLPKTISGKIRRVELRSREAQRGNPPTRLPNEYWEVDLTGMGATGEERKQKE